jgi:monovalent cation:H+ antiporter, CPA1 family
MVAATDPVAVISTFRRLRSPQRLVTLVEGESLFNDGTALVVFSIAVRSVTSPVAAQDWVTAFVGTVVVSVAIGVVAGWVASRVVATIDDRLVELTLSLATAYGTYALADSLHESGVLATVVAGIVLGSYGRRIGMSQRTEEAIDIVWEFIAFLLTALAFLLVGLAISVPRLLEAAWPIAFAVVGALVARAIVIYGLLNGLSRVSWPGRLPRHVPVPWLHVMFWAGLRGAVAVAMALSLPAAFPERQLLQEITFGVVLFTLLFQGTTIGTVARRIRPTTTELTTDRRLGAAAEP